MNRAAVEAAATPPLVVEVNANEEGNPKEHENGNFCNE